MNCFYHPERVAIGLCKACTRGLCAECIVDVSPGCSCRGACEEWAKKVNETMSKSFAAYRRTEVLYKGLSLTFILISLIVGTLAFLSARAESYWGDVSWSLAPVLPLLGLGLFLWCVAKRFNLPTQPTER